MTASTRSLQDIIRQRTELPRTIDYLAGSGQKLLQHASSLIRPAPEVFVTGIGAGWNAALGAGTLFSLSGRPLYIQEARELLQVTAVPRGSMIVAISRTGRLARLFGVDCDSSRICSYIVEDERGLLHNRAEATPNAD